MMMSDIYMGIILAGGIRPSPLARALHMHVICLPVRAGTSLLAEWIDVFEHTGDCRCVAVVVSAAEDVAAIEDLLRGPMRPRRLRTCTHVLVEPRRWRSTGGVVRDVARSFTEDLAVVVAEGTASPAVAAAPLLEALRAGRAAVGVDDEAAPAGLYAFPRNVIDAVPRVGFVDIKEQLLPRLYADGHGACAIPVVDRAIRVRDRASYLTTVARMCAGESHAASLSPFPENGRIAASAVVTGMCLVGDDAVIEEQAIVDSSVILTGATIGRAAVVARSIIGPHAHVPSGARIIDDVVQGRVTARSDRLAIGAAC